MGIFSKKKEDEIQKSADSGEKETAKKLEAVKSEKPAKKISAKIKKSEVKAKDGGEEGKEPKKQPLKFKISDGKKIFIAKNLVKPWISEKSAIISETGKYIFKVSEKASKNAVKDAIESLFPVKIEKVNIMNIKGKPKNFKGKKVFRSDCRKAVVTLKKGQSIDALVA